MSKCRGFEDEQTNGQTHKQTQLLSFAKAKLIIPEMYTITVKITLFFLSLLHFLFLDQRGGPILNLGLSYKLEMSVSV